MPPKGSKEGFSSRSRQEIEPTVSEETWAGSQKSKVYRHPAFGQITVSRISGSRALYGSDFMHSSFVRVTIHKSELRRDLSHDWVFPKGEIVAVDMSEAQWANFVSSFNLGSGVQCTIASLGHEYVPGFPLRDEADEFKADADARLVNSVEGLKRLLAELEAGSTGLSKTKQAALLAPVRKAIQELEHNLKFVSDQFGEHLEKRVEHAKVEVHAYINNVIRQTGIEALQGQSPVMIEGRKEQDDGDQGTKPD